jgi:hypothetical protein
MTTLTMISYHRRRIFAAARDFLVVGVLPASAAVFLGWPVFRSLQLAPAGQKWTILAIFVSDLVLMLSARFGPKSAFFQLPRESYGQKP